MGAWKHRILDLLHGLPAVSPLSLALLLRRPGRMPIFLADTWRAYKNHAGGRLQAITPWDLLEFKGTASLKLGENGVFAAMEPNFLMMQVAAMLQPAGIFEIGTSQGRTTALLAMNTPQTTRIYTLDLSPEEAVPTFATDPHLIELARRELGIAFRDTSWAPRITQLLGNSATFDFSPYYDRMDLVTVDGSHSFEFVRNDSIQAFRMIRPGGVILWHDYESMRSEYGVTRFVDGLRRRHGLPTYRLSRDAGDSRYGVMRVTGEVKKALVEMEDRLRRM
jgi:predicted O-methyltransferase YrrM